MLLSSEEPLFFAMLKIISKYTFLLFLVCTLFLSKAQNIPAQPNPPRLVNDFVMILSGGEREQLEQKLRGYADSTSTQISVVIVKNTGDSDPYDYAMKIAKDWGVGQKDKNNGVLLLWATETRKIRIVTGRGIEAVLPDAVCKRIINTVLKPNFQAGQWYRGLDDATTEMIKRASGEFKADQEEDGGGGGNIVVFVIIIIVIIIFIIISSRNNRGGGGRGFNSGGMWFPPVTMSSWGSSSRGGGGGSGGGFDFGGFGGGDFGGGGAGGDY